MPDFEAKCTIENKQIKLQRRSFVIGGICSLQLPGRWGGGGSFLAASTSELALLKASDYQSNRPTPDVKLWGITFSLRVLVVTIAGRQETTSRTVTLRPPPPVSLFQFFCYALCFYFLFKRSVVVCVITDFETRSGHAHCRSRACALRE